MAYEHLSEEARAKIDEMHAAVRRANKIREKKPYDAGVDLWWKQMKICHNEFTSRTTSERVISKAEWVIHYANKVIARG